MTGILRWRTESTQPISNEPGFSVVLFGVKGLFLYKRDLLPLVSEKRVGLLSGL